MKSKNLLRYYLFSFSNLIAAFGGGTILGKCVGIIKDGVFQGSSIFAFFVGTVLGLAFLQMIPKKIAKNAGQWFAFCGGISSFVLFLIFEKCSVEGALTGISGILFFSVLSIRFGFWFYSRVLRASEAAGYKRRIAWVELGYYSGIILGLIIWQFISLPISISSILLIDTCVQFLAGFLDYLCATKQSLQSEIACDKNSVLDNYNNKSKISWCWRLAISIMLLTIGVQVVTFSLAHLSSTQSSSYILAVFYFGVAIAASVYKNLRVSLEWDNKNNFSYATIKFNQSRVNFLAINILPALLLFLAVIIAFFYQKKLLNIMYLAIFLSAFIYEILALAILDRIGLEEKSLNQSGMVIRAYGLMGIGAAISFWILDILSSTSLNLLILMLISLALSTVALYKRSYLFNE